ncbi:MAG: hypothetical protein WCG27_12645 [Pseudomonadota bacterium]
MKKLIISMKSTKDLFDNFSKVWKKIESGKAPKEPHFEISFQDKKDYDRFVKNIYILMLILKFKPKSIYELARVAQMDLSNIKKIIKFFEELGAVKIKERNIGGKQVKTPLVEYSKIEFDLVA